MSHYPDNEEQPPPPYAPHYQSGYESQTLQASAPPAVANSPQIFNPTIVQVQPVNQISMGSAVEDLNSYPRLREFFTCPYLHSESNCLVYIMLNDQEVYKVIPLKKEALEKSEYFNVVEKNSENTTLRTYKKHPALELDFITVFIPDVEPKNIIKCIEHMIDSRPSQNSEATLKTAFNNSFIKSDWKQLLEFRDIFDFLMVDYAVKIIEDMIADKIDSWNILNLSSISDNLAEKCKMYIRRLEMSSCIKKFIGRPFTITTDVSELESTPSFRFHTPDGSVHQKWTICMESDDVFTIRSFTKQNCVLDVSGGGTDNGNMIFACNSCGVDHQLWKVVKKYGDNGFVLEPVHCEGSALNYATEGSKYCLWKQNGSSHQIMRFNLIK